MPFTLAREENTGHTINRSFLTFHSGWSCHGIIASRLQLTINITFNYANTALRTLIYVDL